MTLGDVLLFCTDRADLLKTPRESDHCQSFVHNRRPNQTVVRNCTPDGHYLCDLCARQDPSQMERG